LCAKMRKKLSAQMRNFLCAVKPNDSFFSKKKTVFSKNIFFQKNIFFEKKKKKLRFSL
jgi:hypothetical protein